MGHTETVIRLKDKKLTIFVEKMVCYNILIDCLQNIHILMISF